MIVEGEKYLGRKLKEWVKELGGQSIKLEPLHFTGLPDWLVLLPGGRVIFIELKTTGDKPRLIQLKIHDRFRALGFQVEVIDNTKKLKEVLWG